jgi:hypothetical protein
MGERGTSDPVGQPAIITLGCTIRDNNKLQMRTSGEG